MNRFQACSLPLSACNNKAVQLNFHLSFSTVSDSHSAMFFFHNKSVNTIFSHAFSAKQTGYVDFVQFQHVL
jgi:hypothetical protein